MPLVMLIEGSIYTYGLVYFLCYTNVCVCWDGSVKQNVPALRPKIPGSVKDIAPNWK